MDKSAYDIFRVLEERHFWRISKRKLILEWLVRYHAQLSNQDILDIGGCSSIVTEKLTNYGEVMVVEPDQSVVETVAKELKEEIAIVEGRLPDMIPTGPFDIVTLFDVLEHVDEDAQSLSTIFSKLKKQGTLLLTVPALQVLWSEHDVSLHHKRRYSKGQIVSLLQDNGFKIIRISYYTSLLLPLAIITRLSSKIRQKNSSEPAKYRVKVPNMFLNKAFLFIMTIERFVMRFCNMPLGLSLIVIAKKP